MYQLLNLILLFGGLLQWCPGAECFMFFQERLPNGERIPHPCKPNYQWYGIGHKNPLGGGSTNLFGKDFKDNGFVWDKCLCEHDSDGDGRSNGEELGDPNCVWKEGDIPEKLKGLSHPGICEPTDDPKCKVINDWDFCIETELHCDGIDEPDVQNFTLQFPETAVPPKETTYICLSFDLPDDDDYHIIATKPIIENRNVMHHLLVFGCEDGSEKTTTPTECNMAAKGCNSVILLWGVGAAGQCFDKNFGFRMGTNGYKTVLMQLHWNNPEEKTDYKDSSGIQVFYTKKLRNNDAGILMSGQTYLEIPPETPSIQFNGNCAPECTQYMNQPIYFTEVILHMHYLGTSMRAEHFRDGKKIIDLAYEPAYNYDYPVFIRLDKGYEFLPGDEVKVSCTFKSLTGQKETVYYGDGTQDEMCFAFMTYYPFQRNFHYCGAHRGVSTCSAHRGFTMLGNCSIHDFFDEEILKKLKANISSACDTTGAKCKEGCQELVAKLKKDQPCLNMPAVELVEDRLNEMEVYVKTGMQGFHSCDPKPEKPNDTPKDNPKKPDDVEKSHEKTDWDRNPSNGSCWYDETMTGVEATTKKNIVTGTANNRLASVYILVSAMLAASYV